MRAPDSKITRSVMALVAVGGILVLLVAWGLPRHAPAPALVPPTAPPSGAAVSTVPAPLPTGPHDYAEYLIQHYPLDGKRIHAQSIRAESQIIVIYLAADDNAHVRAMPPSARTAVLQQWSHAVLTDIQAQAQTGAVAGYRPNALILGLSYREIAAGPLITKPGINIEVHSAASMTCYDEVPQDLQDTHTSLEARPWIRNYHFAEITYWPTGRYPQQEALTCDQWPGAGGPQ